MRSLMFLAAVALTGCAATPADLVSIDTQSLCVDYAQTIITGQGIAVGAWKHASGQQVAQAVVARGDTCAPAAMYLKLAITRLEIQQQRQAISSANIEAAAHMLKAMQPVPLGPSGATGNQ